MVLLSAVLFECGQWEEPATWRWRKTVKLTTLDPQWPDHSWLPASLSHSLKPLALSMDCLSGAHRLLSAPGLET